MSDASTRKIIHIDMDCFYAAIEELEHPELKGLPLAVGGIRTRRGVLTTCNYEARKYGVRSAMPTYKALQLCPQLHVLPPRFELYKKASNRIREILFHFTPLVEPLSLDEAYLDVTHLPYPVATIAAEIRARIFEETQLTASAGIGRNKLLAKIASDWNKPNGQFEVTDVDAFMRVLPVKRLWGVGHVLSEKLERLGVRSCGELQKFSQTEMFRLFGNFGLELYELCRGVDHRAVEPSRERKSLSTESTFETDLETLEACEERLRELYQELVEELRAKKIRNVKKLFVKVKFADFSKTTAEKICDQPSMELGLALLGEAFRRQMKPVRLLGIGVRLEEEKNSESQLALHL